MKRAATPGQAMIKALTEVGLNNRRPYRDFSVRGVYERGERLYTYVCLYGRHAQATILEHANEIEDRCRELGWTVRVRTTRPVAYDSKVHNQRLLDCRVDVSNR